MANPIRDLHKTYTTPGTRRANSAVVVDEDGKVDALDITALSLGGTSVSATAAELNALDGILATVAELNRAADVSTRVVAVTTTPLTLTELAHDGKVITLSKVDGITLTLPAATGSGAKIKVVVVTTVTSVGYIIQVADATDVFIGQLSIAQDSADSVVVFEAAGTSDTITLNGTTKGGIIGDVLEFTDVALNQWLVEGKLSGTGTEETPFSAAV